MAHIKCPPGETCLLSLRMPQKYRYTTNSITCISYPQQKDPRFKGAALTGAWDDEDEEEDGVEGSASVGGGGSSNASVAASQLRVFGKATGLSRVGSF